MAVHEKTGGAIAGATRNGEKSTFVVDMTVRVLVPGPTPDEALENVKNTANWRAWHWLEPRGVSEAGDQ